MGPSAYRAAGIVQALRDLGPPSPPPVIHPNSAIKALRQMAAWTQAIADVGVVWFGHPPGVHGWGSQPVGRHPHRTGAKGRGNMTSVLRALTRHAYRLSHAHVPPQRQSPRRPDRLCDRSAGLRAILAPGSRSGGGLRHLHDGYSELGSRRAPRAAAGRHHGAGHAQHRREWGCAQPIIPAPTPFA